MKRQMRCFACGNVLLTLAACGLLLATATAQGADLAYQQSTNTWVSASEIDVSLSETVAPSNDPEAIAHPKGTISVVTSFPFPSGWSYARDAAWDGSSLWIGENLTSGIVELDPGTGAVLSSFDAPDSNPWGLTFDGTNLINAELDPSGPPDPDDVYTVDRTGTLLNAWPAPTSPNAEAHGCAFDPSTGSLWLSDSAAAVIFELNPTTGAVLSSFPAPGADVRGLAFVAQDLWVIDQATLNLFRLTTAGTTVDTFDISSLGTQPEGLTSDGQYMWVTENSTDTIYQIDVGPIPVELMEFVIE